MLLLKRSILTEKIARHGHHVLREYIVDPFELTRVADVMVAPVDTLQLVTKVVKAPAGAKPGRVGLVPPKNKE